VSAHIEPYCSSKRKNPGLNQFKDGGGVPAAQSSQNCPRRGWKTHLPAGFPSARPSRATVHSYQMWTAQFGFNLEHSGPVIWKSTMGMSQSTGFLLDANFTWTFINWAEKLPRLCGLPSARSIRQTGSPKFSLCNHSCCWAVSEYEYANTCERGSSAIDDEWVCWPTCLHIFLGHFPNEFDRVFSIRALLSVAQVDITSIARRNCSRSQFEFH